jgi:NAD(P)-dependent dehydrogenase (short-subunit alcohol dehydrogenase family)
MAAAASGAVAAGGARAQAEPGRVQTDNAPKELAGKPMPEPSPSQSSGPVAAGRGSNLAGKVAVVTGAARGIGRAIAVEMAANGADIVAVDIAGHVSPASNAVPATPEELEETAKMIRALGRRVETVRADIRDIAALRKIADQTEEQFGKIDIVVANAAIQRWKPLLEMDDADWRDVIDNNLNGTANTIRAFAPRMVAKKKGRILVLSSMQGKHGTKDAASYSASKWGILGLMKSASMELGQYGITVNAVIPGLVDTALTRYEKRLSESMAKPGRRSKAPPHNRRGTTVRRPFRCGSAGCSPTTFPRLLFFSRRTPPLS